MAANGFRRRDSVQQSMMPAVTEKDFQRQVVQLAQLFGWAHYHPFLSIHSQRGWPDLALCRPPRLVLAELKSAVGRVSPDQKQWLDILGQCHGVEAYLWRPADLDRIMDILK
jgi:hypothetical protein